jgi:CubicO group peptidase (beta-lactamase class C family)
MTRATLGLALLFGLSRAGWSQPSSAAPFRLRENPAIARLIDSLRGEIPGRMKEKSLPGLAIALLDRDGIVWAEGFGQTQRTGGRPVDTATIFSIQSMSKTVTATTVLTAVRDGKVDLDAPITTYLPDFTVHSRWEANPERRMTLRILLSHHAGFTHEAPMGNNFDPGFPSFEVYAKSISQTWLRYPVGQRYSYSNLGIDLSGYTLQVVSGRPFPEYVRAQLLEPLGMKRSSFDWAWTRNEPNRAVGHASKFARVPLEFGLIPSGGFYTSVADLSKFVQLHLNRGRVGGRQLIPEQLLDQMGSIQLPVAGQVEGYGLGLGRYRRYGSTFYNHNGGGFGFLTHMSWYPDWGIGLIVLTNSTDNDLSSRFPNEIIDRVVFASLGRVPPAQPASVELETGSLAAGPGRGWLGSYIGRGFTATVTNQGDTLGVDLGGRFRPLQMVSDSTGYAGTERLPIRFVRRADGRPDRLILVLSGDQLDYNDGPNDPPGLDRGDWARYEGEYQFVVWNQDTTTNRVSRKNGYLYFNDLKLEEYQPGLFFTSTGEALDLRGNPPTWRNVKLWRKQ